MSTGTAPGSAAASQSHSRRSTRLGPSTDSARARGSGRCDPNARLRTAPHPLAGGFAAPRPAMTAFSGTQQTGEPVDVQRLAQLGRFVRWLLPVTVLVTGI